MVQSKQLPALKCCWSVCHRMQIPGRKQCYSVLKHALMRRMLVKLCPLWSGWRKRLKAPQICLCPGYGAVVGPGLFYFGLRA